MSLPESDRQLSRIIVVGVTVVVLFFGVSLYDCVTIIPESLLGVVVSFTVASFFPNHAATSVRRNLFGEGNVFATEAQCNISLANSPRTTTFVVAGRAVPRSCRGFDLPVDGAGRLSLASG